MDKFEDIRKKIFQNDSKIYAIEALISALKEYEKAESLNSLAENAVLFANASEDLLLAMSERDVEIADIVQQYFDEKE